MFQQVRKIKGNNYTYIEKSFRVGKKVLKASFLLPKNGELHALRVLNKNSIKRIAAARAERARQQRHAKFFDYGNQIERVEEMRVLFQILYDLLDQQRKDELLNDFLRTFLVNSMAMEGGTISYELAKAIDEKKKLRLDGINKLDIPLYQQLRESFWKLSTTTLRYPKHLRELHQRIYDGIYPFAGKFRTADVTFGDLNDLAITASPKAITRSYRRALQTFSSTRGTVYDFERVITLHKDLQAVHGFLDGNSRMTRLIMAVQFLKLGYPPPLIRGTRSRAYRRALVAWINKKDSTPLLKFFYNNYTQTFNKFWLPGLRGE